MEKWQQKRIEENIVELLKRTTCDRLLLAHFRESKILTLQDIESIDLPNLPESEKTKKLYDLVLNRVGAFDVLLKALEETNQSAALEILKETTSVLRNYGCIQFDQNHELGTNNHGNTPLALAVLDGRTREELKYIVYRGGDFNCKTDDGDSILHYAVRSGKTENVKYLIEKGVDIHSRNNLGEMPIHKICCTKQNFNETLDALIAHGALVNETRNDGATPLALAALHWRTKEDLEHIVYRGGDLNWKDEDGDSILHYVVKRGNVECIKYLFEKGIDIHLKNKCGEMAIHYIWATKQNFYETLDALIAHGGIINGIRNNGATPLALAVLHGRTKEELEYIVHKGGDLNCKDERDNSILHYAVKHGNTENINYLIESGVDIHSKNYSGDMAVHLICWSKPNFNETLDALLSHGALINGTRNDGVTPLALAAFMGRSKEELEYIIQRGGSLSSKDLDGNTILHYAVQRGITENIKFLIEKGVDIHSKNNSGSAAIHFICWNKENFNEIWDVLVALGTGINTTLALAVLNGRSREDLEYIVQRGGDFHCKDEDGNSILHYAVQSGNTENIKYLIEIGADIHSKNNSGAMPIHHICLNKQNFSETLDVLVAHGALINGTRNDGATPLSLAALEGKTKKELEYIVQKGGELNCKSFNGNSVLHYAVQHGNTENINYLIDKGVDIHSKNHFGSMAIHFNCWTKQNFKEILDALIAQGALINGMDFSGATPVALAALHGRSKEDLEYIVHRGGDLNCKDKDGDSIMHNVVLSGNTENIQYLFEKRVDVHSKNKYGEMPIHKIWATKQHFRETLDALIAHGAQINGTRNDGATPLALAAFNGRPKEKLEYIVHRGGDLNSKDGNGDSILHYAVKHGNAENIKYLIEAGANIHSINNSGEMPIHKIWATKQNFNETVDALVVHGALLNGTSNSGATPLALAALVGRSKDELEFIVHSGGNLNCKDKHGDSILHYAVEKGNTEIIKYLLESGLDIHLRDNLGEVPIHKIRFTTMNFEETLDTLLSNGADINCVDKCNRSTLDLAKMRNCDSRKLEMIAAKGGRTSAQGFFKRLKSFFGKL